MNYIESYFKGLRQHTVSFLDLLFEVKMTFLGYGDYLQTWKKRPPESTKLYIDLAENAIKIYRDRLQKRIKSYSLEKLLYLKQVNIDSLIDISFNFPLLVVSKEYEIEATGKRFWRRMGIYLYIEKELQERLIETNQIGDGNTLSKPFMYVAFELINRINKSGYFNVSEEAKELLEAFKKDAEKITKGLYLPDDTDRTKNNKFVSGAEGKESKTEAEGFFDEQLAELLNANFSNINSIDDLIEKMYEWDIASAYFPRRFQSRFLSKIESNLTQNGVSVTIQKELRTKRNRLLDNVKGNESSEQIEQVAQELEMLIKNKMSITTDEEFPGEKVEYFIKDPERRAIEAERREKICFELRTWAGKQPKQAHLAQEVVEYIIRAVTNPTLDFEEAFQVTNIAEALNKDRKTSKKTTKKEVRSVLNKIKEDLPFLESLSD